ncbi:TonB-dependent receptor plug domain-containing protein [Sphingomonas bacterium]|uniref:TonB-dependent receptor plug domain-containing protein n=1 Tax=Sphingomonas bacterium TaxID=1895847 RepID=UPI00266EBD8D|nr:TonB-dependent receptor [Sphingomonas bacterium]
MADRRFRHRAVAILLIGTAGVCAHSASAQSVISSSSAAKSGESQTDSAGSDAIVVTGTRIVRDGYQSPTPTTVLGVEELQRKAPINIADQVNQLPSLAGSSRNNTNSISGGGIGVNSLNLRNLGVTRTLILLDGQRMPAATTGGAVDVNTIPNNLVKRVDIVTGGASAAWGSDAVAGVVNFVLDKDFTGIKGDIVGGITTYGDDPTFKASIAAGTHFADGRGHIMVSGEVAYDDGIRKMPRSWFRGTKQLFSPTYTATNGQPELLVRENVGYTTLAPGGIVTAGPLRGLYFGPNGTPTQLNYGSIVRDPSMVGGDWQVTDFATTTESLLPTVSRQNAFGRASYEIFDNVEIYGQFSYGRSKVKELSSPQYQFGGLTIQRDNAFLPASVVSRMQSLGLTSLTIGTSNDAIGPVPYTGTREMYRYVVGANGKFRALGTDWSWDVFYNRNITDLYQNSRVGVNANYARAIDAVIGPNGSIVCRSTLTDPTNGCAPLNIIGTGVATQSGLNYVLGNSVLNNKFTQQEYAASMRGEPFSTWAGPVSVAFGVEHRSEASSGTNDPISRTNGFFYGNYKPLNGSYKVTEGFFETVVPLVKDTSWTRSLDFNGAVRITDYSTSGRVTTWKVGGVWKPIDDITLRITQSRDIRAGNLSDLYQVGRTGTISINDPARNNESYTIVSSTVGNTEIKPEKARSFNVGGVVQPRFLPGFSIAVDYFSIDVRGVIATLTAPNLLNLCYTGGDQSLCQFVARNSAGLISTITLKPVNLARQRVRGIDFEASYQVQLSDISSSLGNGRFTLRALASHYLQAVTDTGIIGNVPQVALGAAEGTPRWRYRVEGTYSNERITASITGRGVSSGVLSPMYIECTTNCPVSTANNRTIDNNHVDGALYFDASFSVKITPGLESFLVVENFTNKDPAQVASGTSVAGAQWGVSGLYYDLYGRTFRAGIRFKY